MTRSRTARRPDPMARRLALAFAGIVVVALAIAIGTTTGTTDSSPPTSAFGEPVVTGQPLPRLAGGDDPAIGFAAPVAAGVGVDGGEVTVGGGGPQVVAFLAHWCSHCRAEVPVVVEWLSQGRLPGGVDLVAVATSSDEGQPNFPPQDWLAREAWPQPVLLDDADDTVGQAFGVSSFPFWVALDADGEVVMRVAGELTPEQLDVLFAMAAGPRNSG